MAPGAIIAEVTRPVDGAELIGRTVDEQILDMRHEPAKLNEMLSHFEKVLEPVFPTRAEAAGEAPVVSCETRVPAHSANITVARPRALIVSFPGTNSEIDTAKAVARAGGVPEIAVIKNLTPELLADSVAAVKRSIENAQMVIIPGGFSGGDEPDGSAKFITAFFRNPAITDAIHELLQKRDGLMLGICNGFQALIKLGLVPYGEITQPDKDSPTLTFNTIGRHQAKYVYTRVASLKSPWMSGTNLGDIHALPVSHGEGRFVANGEVIAKLIANGQLATQYCDNKGVPSMDIEVNPNGSAYAIEGIFSPDGRVFGKMGHSERRGPYVAKNIPGNKHQPVFESGIRYFL
jgi:phosphoribosylformylglycinamidine synthase